MVVFVPRDESQIYIKDTGIGKIESDQICSFFLVSFWQVKEYKIQKDTTTRQWYVWQDIIWILETFPTLSKILLGRTQQDTRTDKDTREAYRISEHKVRVG